MNYFLKMFNLFFNPIKHEPAEVTLKIDPSIDDFVKNEILPGLEISPHYFWSSFEKLLKQFTQRNKDLLTKRKSLQDQINNWHKNNPLDLVKYKTFLEDIGYLAPRQNEFKISTWNVDPEIRKIAGPQLVVPVMNARFALNAANARWGSLYDALYGTNVIGEEDGAIKEGGYNPIRGEKVILFSKKFLDESIPLINGNYKDVIRFEFIDGELSCTLEDGTTTKLKDQNKYIGYMDKGEGAYGLLFKNNNLHFEIQVDRSHPIGQEDAAGIKDILMESAITTIQDCEDSVAAVDAEDKIIVYRNWLGLMKGNLKRSFDKNGKYITRELNPDRKYLLKNGKMILLPGRSLMLVRNVGHLMTNPSIKDQMGNAIPEGIMDAYFTVCMQCMTLLAMGYIKTLKQRVFTLLNQKCMALRR